MNDEALRYPTGKFLPLESYNRQQLDDCIRRISDFPKNLEVMAAKLTARQLDIAYREGGWTARQVIHHVADSHMNAYIRFKWTLTENIPVIKVYNEKLWAETPEVRLDPSLSLDVIRALHAKWAALLGSLSLKDLQREYIHPETKKNLKLATVAAMYAWHGEHHLGHLRIISEK